MINKYFLSKMNIPAYLKNFLYNRYRYTEIEGIPPIIFNGNGKILLDYRIDGASGGVGDRTKNLLKNTATSQTINGVTFTVNNDGSVTCNGTPNSGIYSDLLLSGTLYGEKLIIEYGNYIFSSIGSSSALAVIIGNGTHEIGRARGNDVTFTDDVSWVLLRCYGVEEPQTVYPMIRLASIQDDTYEPYGYKVPVVVSGKNLLQNTATTQTINGVNVIVNNDGSIKLSGTSTAITYIDINSNFNSTEFQDCYLNPFYPNKFVSSASTVLLRISNKTNRNSIQDFLSNSVIRDNGSNLRLAIRIGQNYTFSNDFVISPMISKFSDNTYEPYIEPTTTNIYLDEPIEENESISLSDTNVNIPTIKGTNVLTVDTTVQPSKVYIKVGGF